MVVLSAIFGGRNGPSAAVVDAVATGDVRLAISDDGLAEFVRAVGYPETEELIERPVRAVEVALSIGLMGYMHIRGASTGPASRTRRTAGSSTSPTPRELTTSFPTTGTSEKPPRPWNSWP